MACIILQICHLAPLGRLKLALGQQNRPHYVDKISQPPPRNSIVLQLIHIKNRTQAFDSCNKNRFAALSKSIGQFRPLIELVIREADHHENH
ncbi:MAG TPA: hypothetical protein DD729_00195 [Rhodobacteraceae bacterium]|nr:hypothetical protein [Paracoccaceae bacterium]